MGGKLFLRLAGAFCPWLACVCLGVSAWAVNVPPKDALTMFGQQVTVNDDDANGNDEWDKDDDGPIPNGRPLLRQFSIYAKGVKGGGIVTIDPSGLAGHAKLWADANKTNPLPLKHNVSLLDLNATFWAEGIATTENIDSLELKADYVPRNHLDWKAVASFKFGVFQVDLDVDSSNDNGLIAAGYTDAEDKTENAKGKPGKVLFPTNGDLGPGWNLVPVRVQLKVPIDPTKAKVTFTYNAFTPRLGEGNGTVSGQRGLRLWKVDGDERRSGRGVDAGGDFIPSDKAIAWKDVAGSRAGREATLYLEYVDREAAGPLSSQESIAVQVMGPNAPNDVIDEIKVSLNKTIIKAIASHPNNPLALNNKFIDQNGTVEVLKGWKNRYSGTTGLELPGASYVWERRPFGGGEWAAFGTKKIIEHEEDEVGDFSVRFAMVKDGMRYSSAERRVKVVELQVDEFELRPDGNYTLRNRLWARVAPPASPESGIKLFGKLSKINGSPPTEKIKQGFIQGFKGNINVRRVAVKTEFLTPAIIQKILMSDPEFHFLVPAQLGDSAVYAPWLQTLHHIPLVNDASLGNHLYDSKVPVELGQRIEWTDTPGFGWGGQMLARNAEGTRRTAIITYANTDYQWNTEFPVWLVAFNEKTNQYVPLRQQSWKLEIDIIGRGPWPCTVMGNPAEPSSRPTDASTSAEKYMKQGQHNLKGAEITVRKLR